MNDSQRGLSMRAAELRAEFDHGFATLPPGEPPPHVDLLAIRCADQGFALRLSEVLSLSTERKIVPIPAPAAELLGLASLRGIVAPVYDLRALLGYPAGNTPRWLALVRAPAPFAIGFEQFEQHLRVAIGALVIAAPDETAPHPFARGSVKTTSGLRPLIDLVALFSAVTGRRPGAPEREDPR